MKGLATVLLALVLGAPAPALAQSSALTGAVAGATAGAVVASGPGSSPQQLPPALVGKQLIDWTDPATKTTSRFYSGCGVAVELQLSGRGPANYLDVTIINSSEQPVSFRPAEVRVKMRNVERFLRSSVTSEVIIQEGWWVRTVHEFPDKRDFKGLRSMFVRLPVTARGESCEIVAPIHKDPTAPTSRSTFKTTSTIDLLFEGGSRLQAFGPLSDFGGRYGPGFGVLFGFYPWGPHGLAFDIQLESYGDSAVGDFEDKLDVPDNSRFTLASFMTGYIFKYHLHPHISVHYGLTAGMTALELGSQSENARSKVLFGARQRVRVDFVFAQIDDMKLGLAPSFFHYVLPHASFAGVEASGHAIGTTLGLIMTN